MLSVTVVYSPAARRVDMREVRVASNSTVADAVAASGVLPPDAELGGKVGIWGHPAGPDSLLCDGDRVEIWRPLRIDPKLARRERFGRQGARATGLFARKRPGAKAGY